MRLKEKLSDLIQLLAKIICVILLGYTVFHLYVEEFYQALASTVLLLVMMLAWGFMPWQWSPGRNDSFVSGNGSKRQKTQNEKVENKPSSVWLPLLLCMVFLLLGILKREPILLGVGLVFSFVFFLRRRAKKQK